MKKKYINPILSVIKVETSMMLATSGFQDSLNTDCASGDKALSRRGYSFDDDEE